jgi:hypothetical protein
LIQSSYNNGKARKEGKETKQKRSTRDAEHNKIQEIAKETAKSMRITTMMGTKKK